MNIEHIQSPHNPRVKNLVRLRNARHRRRQGLFLVEGLREISRALEHGLSLQTLFFCPEHFKSGQSRAIIDKVVSSKIEVCQLSATAFAKCSLRENPDGLLAVAPVWETKFEDVRFATSALLLVVESVEKPGNLGSLIRTAEAAGADALIVTDPVADIFNPNVIRNSQGALFGFPVVVGDNDASLAWLKGKGVQILATSPAANENFWRADLKAAFAIVVGSEKDGLSDFWLGNATHRIKIPMAGRSDSLNVNVAAAVTLYEAVRQRSA